MTEPIFAWRDGAYVPSGHARGPWDAGAQHGGAPAALLAREIERLEPGADMLVARLSYEFLGPVALAPVTVTARIARPGRRFQLAEAQLEVDGQVAVRARAVRLRRAAIELPQSALGGPSPPLPSPDDAVPVAFPQGQEAEGLHRTGMDMRFTDGTDYGIGSGRAWFRLRRPLVDDEPPTALQRLTAAADFGNGISRALDFETHLFVNTDLTVHVVREPVGEWVLLDAQTVIDPGGVGLATSKLHDELGPIGVAAQTLFVAQR